MFLYKLYVIRTKYTNMRGSITSQKLDFLAFKDYPKTQWDNVT